LSGPSRVSVGGLEDVFRKGFPLIVGVGLIGLGMLVDRSGLAILQKIMILGLFAIAYNFLLGYTGILSFGHAAFFGLGAYSLVYITNNYPELYFLQILAFIVVASVVISFAMGAIALQRTGVYFAMITLALAQMLYILSIRLDVTGGVGGLPLRSQPETLLPVDLANGEELFVLTVVVFVVSYFVIRRILQSPMGEIFQAIRSNEDRTEMVGIGVFRYKLIAFTISGVFATVAGVIHAIFFFFTSPSTLYWTTSGDVLIVTILGGMGSLVGPVIGAAFFILSEEFLSEMTDQWLIFVGVLFIFVIIFFPKGIYGTTREWVQRLDLPGSDR
jgi:branched-chain amino acid transport system permease protein